MVARVNRLNWRTNQSASLILRIFVPEPREGIIRRINWWQYGTVAEAGNITSGDFAALIEGPLPEGITPSNMPNNSLRDDQGLHVLVQAAPGSSTATNTAPEKHKNPFYTFPGGIWTVEELWVGFVTEGGVDNLYASIGFEDIRISKAEWVRFRRSSLNSSDAGELIQ